MKLILIFLIGIFFFENCDGIFEILENIFEIYPKYKPKADRILNFLLQGPGKGQAYAKLANFTDLFGPRMVGSKNLENCIDFLSEKAKNEGFKVGADFLTVPKWVRGFEAAKILSPRPKKISILGLGNTGPTTSGGISAEAVIFRSFQELDQMGEKIRGKIVVFNQPWKGYADSSNFRVSGAQKAAQYGAVAALIRSAASHSIYSPHTGMMSPASIPGACIAVEDAEYLQRLQDQGEKIKIWLRIDSRMDGNTTTRNTIIDFPGWKTPDEYVLIGGHLDSWDVGEGAMDDGSGVAISWQALSTLKKLGLQPKKTIRVVFWTAEEFGHIGGRDFYQKHKNESYKFVAESDAGAFKPTGLHFKGPPNFVPIMKEVLQLLRSINATNLYELEDAGDVEDFSQDGIPSAWLENPEKLDYYFQFHHSNGDFVTIYNPEDLDFSTALWTVVSYVMADLE